MRKGEEQQSITLAARTHSWLHQHVSCTLIWLLGRGPGNLSTPCIIQIPSHRPADSLTGYQARNTCGRVLYRGWRS